MSSGNHRFNSFAVEARVGSPICMNHLRPVTLYDGILTTEWREVEFASGANPAGVPNDYGLYPSYGGQNRLLPYESAVALAWTIVAQHRHKGVECRIVRYKNTVEWAETREGILDLPNIGESYTHIPLVKDADISSTPESSQGALAQKPPAFTEEEIQATQNDTKSEGK